MLTLPLFILSLIFLGKGIVAIFTKSILLTRKHRIVGPYAIVLGVIATIIGALITWGALFLLIDAGGKI
jgi:hypothetical protein